MIDIMNAESIKYCDQNNVDAVQILFNKHKPTFMRARKFQEKYNRYLEQSFIKSVHVIIFRVVQI